MNEKSKSVCMGFNFHNKWFLWGVLGREIATDLPNRASGTITIAKMGAAGSAAPILSSKCFQALEGCLGSVLTLGLVAKISESISDCEGQN